jgi:hypothetical protein
MSEGHEPRRRWFRFAFSLRTLFIVVTILIVWIGWNVNRVRERTATIQYISRNAEVGVEMYFGREQKPWRGMPLAWQWLGAEPVALVVLPKIGAFDEDDRRAISRLFPEAQVIFRP